MPIDHSAQALAQSVKRRASMPTSQSLFEIADLIAFMSEEVQSTVAPTINSVREEYYVHIQDVPIVTTQKEYPIPYRAMGNALRDVVLIDSAGNEINLPRLAPEILKANPVQTSNRLFGFYLQNEKVSVFPNTDGYSGYSVRFRYKRVPSQLTEKSSAGVITAINPSTQEVTVSAVPATWTAATIFDFVGNAPPFVSKSDDQAVSGIITNVLTFVNTLPTDLALGDWVAEASFSPVPQIPYFGFNWLAQLGVVRALESLGDNKGLDNAYKASDRMKNDFVKNLTPRTQGSPQKINNRNGIFDWAVGFGSRRGGTY